jgi:hypothetical protein
VAADGSGQVSHIHLIEPYAHTVQDYVRHNAHRVTGAGDRAFASFTLAHAGEDLFIPTMPLPRTQAASLFMCIDAVGCLFPVGQPDEGWFAVDVLRDDFLGRPADRPALVMA